MTDYTEQNRKLYPLKPFDLLRCVKSDGDQWTERGFYFADQNGWVIDNRSYSGFTDESDVPSNALFERVTIAEPWTPENNEKFMGLLTPDQVEAMKAAKHGWWLRVKGKWQDCNKPVWNCWHTFRAKPAPEMTVQEAARVLLPLAEKRQLPFYLVDMPMDAKGNGPATIGGDATDMAFQVWRASDLSVRSQRTFLSDAIPFWLRALAGDDQ